MTQLMALRTNVHVWQDPFFAWLDTSMEAHDVKLLDLPWDACALYRHDTDHFTWRGFVAFAAALARVVKTLDVPTLHVYADSTVDYHNWADGVWTGRADEHLRRSLRAVGVRAHVDAVSGSGFWARADERVDFESRAARLAAPHAAVLLVGGWNDRVGDRAAVADALRRTVRRFRE